MIGTTPRAASFLCLGLRRPRAVPRPAKRLHTMRPSPQTLRGTSAFHQRQPTHEPADLENAISPRMLRETPRCSRAAGVRAFGSIDALALMNAACIRSARYMAPALQTGHVSKMSWLAGGHTPDMTQSASHAKSTRLYRMSALSGNNADAACAYFSS
jgi:hypothetical protein